MITPSDYKRASFMIRRFDTFTIVRHALRHQVEARESKFNERWNNQVYYYYIQDTGRLKEAPSVSSKPLHMIKVLYHFQTYHTQWYGPLSHSLSSLLRQDKTSDVDPLL